MFIAAEAGLEVLELSSPKRFDEIGPDSLLSISVIDQLRRDCLEFPTSIWNFLTLQELECFWESSDDAMAYLLGQSTSSRCLRL